MSRTISEGVAKHLKAYVIVGPRYKEEATVHVFENPEGDTIVDVWDVKLGFQQGSNSGQGTDGFTAALSGLIVAGHKMYGHSQTSRISERALVQYHQAFDNRKGTPAELNQAWALRLRKRGLKLQTFLMKEAKYHSVVHIAGLEQLRALGYHVYKAI